MSPSIGLIEVFVWVSDVYSHGKPVWHLNSIQSNHRASQLPLSWPIFGINFLGEQNLSTNDTTIHIFINDYGCHVTGMTDTQINCSIPTLERGDHLITGTFDGFGYVQSSLYITSNAMIDDISPNYHQQCLWWWSIDHSWAMDFPRINPI